MAQRTIDYGLTEKVGELFVWAVKYMNGTPCGVKWIAREKCPTRAELPALTYEVGDDYERFMDQVWPKIKTP
jgi:hypothetical protein